MPRCKKANLLSKISPGRLNDDVEVSLAVLTDPENCIKINTVNYISFVGNPPTFNRYKMPADAFNCLPVGCTNSGTLLLSGAAGTAVGAKFAANYDATDFFGGLTTFYIEVPTDGTYEIELTISDMTDASQANSDVYSQRVVAKQSGFVPVLVDFSKAPQTQAGTGWSASEKGAIVNVSVKPQTASVIPNIGISSFYFYNSIEELITNAVVKFGCVQSVAKTLTISALETACAMSGYDETSAVLEYTITANNVTPNAWLLNPLLSKSQKNRGWVLSTSEKIIESTTIDGIDYGYVQVLDLFTEECGFTTAQLAKQCNVHEAELQRVSSPVLVDLDERQFILLDGVLTGVADTGKFLFNKALIGQRVNVSYPAARNIESFDITTDALNTRRVRMAVPTCQSDGVQGVDILDHVLVTSSPLTRNREDTSMEITLSIRRGPDGKFGESNRVVE